MRTSLRPVGKRSCAVRRSSRRSVETCSACVACPKRVCGRTAPDAPERVYDQGAAPIEPSDRAARRAGARPDHGDRPYSMLTRSAAPDARERIPTGAGGAGLLVLLESLSPWS